MFFNILNFLAGIGLFLYSIHLLSKNMEMICGNKLRKKLNNISTNRLKNVGVGFLSTIAMQSTTATMALVVGFSNAQIINLFQGLALVVGLNIASSLPCFIVSFSSFKITPIFCSLIIIGFIFLSIKNNKLKQIGNIIISFSLLFIGLDLMSSSTSFLKENEFFINLFTIIKNPILLTLIGSLFTIIIQSSLGTFAVVISLVGTVASPGVLSVESAYYLIYGANIGTAISTALVLIFSANKTGKRLCLFHIIYAIIGSIIFLLLSLTKWHSILDFIGNYALQIAIINFIFNFVVSLLLLPLLKPSCKVLKKLFNKTKRKDNEILLIEDLPESTSLCITITQENICKLYNKTIDLISLTYDSILSPTDNKKLIKKYDVIKTSNSNISKALIRINTTSKEEEEIIEKFYTILVQLDKMSRNCKKITDIMFEEDNLIKFNSKEKYYINKLYNFLQQAIALSKKYITKIDLDCINQEIFTTINSLQNDLSKYKIKAKNYIYDYNNQNNLKNTTCFLYIINYLDLLIVNNLDIIYSLHKNKLKTEQIELKLN